MQNLAVKLNLLFNDLTIKSVITDLDSLIQDSITLAPGAATVINNITKVFYIKTNISLLLTLNQASETFELRANDSCLLTADFTSITVQNPDDNSAGLTADIFIVRGATNFV